MKVKNNKFLALLWVLSITLFCWSCSSPASEPVGPEPEPQPWQWRQVADFGGTAVTFSRAFVINDRAYVGTGYDPTRAFWMYDPAADAWTRKADFGGEARGAAVAFAIGARGYIGMGYGNNGQCGDLWEYDPAADRWTQKASIPGAARDHAGAFSIGQKAYVFGGTAGTDANAVMLREVWEYDPPADTWTRKGDMPEGLSEPACFVLNGRGYAGTGIFGTTGESQRSRHLYDYDPQSDTWTRKADFPGAARYIAAGFAHGGKGYIATGMESFGQTTSTVFRDVWEYEPTADAWTARPDFSGPARGGAVGFALNSYLYIGTGTAASNQKLRDFWRCQPSS